jgi:nitrite reductase/ring-hydroxylating ferredoxin subunit
MDLPLESDVWHPVIKSEKLKLGKKKMLRIGLKSLMVVRESSRIYATDALCRHMAWPLAYGGKINDECIEFSKI